MKLRNNKTYGEEQVKKQTYEINIDFDLASREWRKNKVKYGQGCFRYLRRSQRTHK
jgi:hypothetical protein